MSAILKSIDTRAEVLDWAESLKDMHELDRRLREGEIRKFDEAANHALRRTHRAIELVADELSSLDIQCFKEDALVLVHSVWKLLRKSRNQHLPIWGSVTDELESVMLALIDGIEESEADHD